MEERILEESSEIEEGLWDELMIQMRYVKDNGLPILDYYKAFAKVEPYCNYPSLVEKIQKEIEKYE